MTLLPIKSTRNMFPGIIVQGSATISQDVFISGSLNANIVGKFPIGDGLDLQHGTLSSTVTGGGGTTTILSGTNIQVGGGTVSVVDSPNFSGTVVSNGIIVLATVTGSSPPAVTFSSPTVGPNIALGITPVGTSQTGATIVYGAFDRYTVASGVSTLLSLSDLFILGNNTASTIRSYNSYEYHITVPLTVDQVKSMPLGSGLASANGTIYATGGASTGTVSAYEVLSPSNTLTFDVTLATISASVVSSTISIVNAETVSSPAPFQQKFSVNYNLSGLSNYANATLTNIQFSDISGATIIPSWRESGTINSGTAIYWLLLEQGISANSTLYVKMNLFTNSQSVLNASDTGLSPILPLYYGGTYGENDTGSVVFAYAGISSTLTGLYDNFAGTVLSDQWYTITNGQSSTGTYSLDGGLTLTTTSTQGINFVTYASLSYPMWTEYYVAAATLTATNDYLLQFGNNGTNDTLAFYLGTPGYTRAQYSTSGTSYAQSSSIPIVDTTGNHLYSMNATGTIFMLFDYGTIYSDGSTYIPTDIQIGNMLNLHMGFTTPKEYFIRTRSTAPNNIMPSAVSSSLATSVPTFVFPDNSTFINGPNANWAVVSGKPYLTVSADGIVNNATITIINNGADYGPDTFNTRSSGINEALQSQYGSAFPLPVHMLPGNFIIHEPILISATLPLDTTPKSPMNPAPSLIGASPQAGMSNQEYPKGTYISVADDFPTGEYAIAYTTPYAPYSGQLSTTYAEISNVEMGNFTVLCMNSSGTRIASGVNLYGLTNSYIHDIGVFGARTPSPTTTGSPTGFNIAAFQMQENNTGGPNNRIERMQIRYPEQDGFFFYGFSSYYDGVVVVCPQRYGFITLSSSSLTGGNPFSPTVLHNPECDYCNQGNNALYLPSGTVELNITENSTIPTGGPFPSGIPAVAGYVVANDMTIITPQNFGGGPTTGPAVWIQNYRAQIMGGILEGSNISAAGTVEVIHIADNGQLLMLGTNIKYQPGLYPVIKQSGAAQKSYWIQGAVTSFGNISGTQLISLESPNSVTVQGVIGLSDKGFGIGTPTLPGGTGTANAVVNGYAYPVIVYQQRDSINALGTGIIDHLGNVATLYSDPESVTLQPGDAIFYSSTVTTAWKWYGQ